jgi:hypothetical protein
VKRAAWLALAVAVAAGCLALAARTSQHRAGSSAADRSLHFAFDWPRGTTYRYAFDWRAETQIQASPAPSSPGKPGGAPQGLTGRVRLEGDLVLSSMGRVGDAYRFVGRIESLRECSLDLFGSEVLASGPRANEALVGHDAVVELDPDGRLRAVRFEKEAPPIFKHVMESILEQSEAVVHADGDRAWSARETTLLGEGTASYEVEQADPPRLLRERAPYDTLFALPGRKLAAGEQSEQSEAAIVLDPRGVVASLVEDETLEVKAAGGQRGTPLTSTSHFGWELKGVGAWTPADREVASLDTRTPGQLVPPADAERQILEQRIRGLTAEQMRTSLLAFGQTGRFPTKDWLLRASGLLTQHPELCMDLVSLFEHEVMTDRGRAQIAELLAGTGTPEAQDALREVIASPAARANPRLEQHALQAFLVVAHPTADSLAFLREAFQTAKADGGGRYSSALALGAAAGNALRSGNAAAAGECDAELRRALADAKKPHEKRELLDALGNVGLAGDVTTIRAFAADADAQVRSSAAFALRKIDSDDARQALVSFAADPSADVETSAFGALGHEPLGQDDLAALSRVVTSGGTQQPSDSALLGLLAAHTGDGEPVRAMLRFLLTRNGADNTMMAEIRRVLAST